MEPLEKDHTPKPMTASENVILTLKVLGGGGVLLFLLWLVEQYQK